MVVDDGSRDGTAALLAREQPHGTLRAVSTGRREAVGHEELTRFLLAVVVARRSRLLPLLLALPYARHLALRRSGPLLAPFLLAVDLVELAAVVKGAIRNRVLVV